MNSATSRSKKRGHDNSLKSSDSNRNKKKTPDSSRKTTLSKDRCILACNGYYVGGKIDSGTFATVRFAEKNTQNGTLKLAVKVIDKSKTSPLFTEKFLLRELEIWPRLCHRHIIQVEQMYQIQDRIYIFMELASKGSIIEYLQKYGAVDEEVARMWCKNMCQALRYCHKKGVAHRDLKCDNLLLDHDYQVKIGDFGFCCRSYEERTGKMLYSETYCGSSSYVAPEVIEGIPYDPISADSWSAGVCIYVILNNAMPFDDNNIKAMYEDQVHRNWDFVPEAAEQLSQASKKLVKRMLEPHPGKRMAMEEVLASGWMRKPLMDPKLLAERLPKD